MGLLPPGNASWFNPLYWKLDYYYSHNFWASATLDHVIKLATILGRHADAEKYEPELEKYKQNIDDSITAVTSNLDYLPAGPYQRDNASMVFNLLAYYPLKQYNPAFQALHNTLEWLWHNYSHNGGILIDAPWNAYGSYFSMIMAQAWRYVGNSENVERVLDFLLKNVTNKSGWAEGISPLTRLGSVGDSPNGFAAAEFVNLILDLFAEDYAEHPPILLKGMPIPWLKAGISAKGLQLFYGAKLDLDAKLEGSKLNLAWNYENEINDHLPVLFVPYPIKAPHGDLEQLSTNEYQLLTASGKLEIELDIN